MSSLNVLLAKQSREGLGYSQQEKISAPAAGRNRSFFGSVATIPMVALFYFTRNGKEGDVGFCNGI